MILHYGYMENPRVPAALASLPKAGLKFDLMTTSSLSRPLVDQTRAQIGHAFFAGPAFYRLWRQAANGTDSFAIPSDRVVELGAHVTV